MVPDVPSAPSSDSQSLLSWLEQQRQADHERLIELGRVVEQLSDEARAQRAVLNHLQEAERGTDETQNTMVEGIAQLKEHIGLVQRSLVEHIEATARTEQVEVAQRERLLRQTSELAQQILALSRSTEATQGRLSALAEEVRRLRDERPPVLQSLDELQRSLASLQSRVAVTEEMARRHGTFQSLAEQSDEQLRADLSRVDNQQKLLDVRWNREIGELRRSLDELVSRMDERLKPITELARQVVGLVEHRGLVDQRLAGLTRELEHVRSEIDRLESLARADRATTKRLTEQIEGSDRKHDQVASLVWQLGERVTTALSRLSELSDRFENTLSRIEASERQIAFLDDERQRLDSSLSAVETQLHAEQRGRGDQSESLRAHVDAEVAFLQAQIQGIRRQAVEQVRRTVEVLQQQLRELEADQG